MSDSPAWDTQVAVMAALAAVVGLPVVYDTTPEKGTPRPFGVYGDSTHTRRGVFAQKSGRHGVMITWWGNEREPRMDGGETVHGFKQVKQYAALAKDALDGRTFALEGGLMVGLRWEQDITRTDRIEGVRGVQQQYRIDTVS